MHNKCISLLTVVALVSLVTVIKCARRKRDKHILSFTDCGKGEEGILHFYDVRANPLPIIMPGTLYVSFRGNISRDMPSESVSIELSLTKYLPLGIPFTLPCFQDTIGSCKFEDVCDKLKQYQKLGCPKRLRHHGVQCRCPFTAGEFNVKDLPLNIPKVGGFAGSLIRVRGAYDLTVRVLDESQKDEPKELGCLTLNNFYVKKRYRGWLFKI